MRRVSDTIARLAAARLPLSMAGTTPGRLAPLDGFGSNPGALRAFHHVPADLPRGAALVVALHGCTQTAAAYDHGTGWSTLADREGFVVLLPEQQRSNNANLCFNWFEPADMARLGGEPESIAQMIEALVARHGIDRDRIFVTGLSAGGAMAAVMLATWPDVFAAGAIIGGLPYACAATVSQALDRMRGSGGSDEQAATMAVRRAGGQPAAWPRVAIWHGTADTTVVPANMGKLTAQWRGVHGLASAPSLTEQGANWQHRRWTDAAGVDLVEEWSITGMGHGVPVDPQGPGSLGAAGPYMLDVGLSSTALIAQSWQLSAAMPRPAAVASTTQPSGRADPALHAADSVQDLIERTLKSVGLMR